MTTEQRPAYRYLEPPPPPDYGAFGRGIRWALLGSVAIALLIFIAVLVVSSVIGGSP